MDIITIILLIAILAILGFSFIKKSGLSENKSDEKLIQENARLTADLSIKDKKIGELMEEFQAQKSEKDVSNGENKQLSIKIANLESKVSQLEADKSRLDKEKTILEQTESDRENKYKSDITTLNSIKNKIESDREKEIKYQQDKEIARINGMKETWKQHEKNVEERIKQICREKDIEYIDKEKIPFKGKPDNTIKISDKFVIFDAKSPGSDNLENFPKYIKDQTELVKKYIKEENVRKHIYLVIPSNTVNVIDQFSFNIGADYNVYVVTLDALEPIILSLKELEGYEFYDQLAPEERDDICRIIGKFAHITKRRIQIDQFFWRQFLDTFSKFGDMPHDIQEKINEYERSEKLNPPQEKRVKSISIKELEDGNQKIKKEAEAKEITFPDSMHQMLDE